MPQSSSGSTQIAKHITSTIQNIISRPEGIQSESDAPTVLWLHSTLANPSVPSSILQRTTPNAMPHPNRADVHNGLNVLSHFEGWPDSVEQPISKSNLRDNIICPMLFGMWRLPMEARCASWDFIDFGPAPACFMSLAVFFVFFTLFPFFFFFFFFWITDTVALPWFPHARAVNDTY